VPDLSPPDFFKGNARSFELFEAVRKAVEEAGPSDMRTTKSQIAFRRKRGFAWVWMPEMYLKREAAPLVLTVGLRRRDGSPRWKQVVEPYRGRFMHHLEVYAVGDIDEEVHTWIAEAWALAG